MIAGEVRRYLRDNSVIRVSRSIRDVAYKVLQCKEALTASLGREPTLEEISKALELPREEVSQALDAVWEEEQVKFIEDNATACDSSPLNQYQRRFSQDVAPQYVDISAGGGK